MSTDSENALPPRELRLPFMRNARNLNWIQRLKLLPIRLLSGIYPPPHIVMSYKRNLYGLWFSHFTSRSMRGSDHWSIEELEIFAAFTAKQLACEF